MTVEELDQLLKDNKQLTKSTLGKISTNKILDLLEKKADTFNYEKDYLYLRNIFEYLSLALSRGQDSDKEKIYKRLQNLHDTIRVLILQKPGNIEKTHTNYQVLKKAISNIEAISLSYLYDYTEKYQNNTYSFVEYLIFDLKNYLLVEDALNRFPYIAKLFDQNNVTLVEKIIQKYFEETINYTSNKELKRNDDLIYYDDILSLFLKNEEDLDFVLKQSSLKRINTMIEGITPEKYNDLTKRKLVFWLNNLKNKINKTPELNQEDDINTLMYKYGIKSKFDEGVLSEARQRATVEKKNIKGRRILSQKECIITIDGDNAQELDDGLSAVKLENGNYLLGVHIADPLGYIPINNIIMDEALKRTTSIYLSDMNISQFPPELAKNIMTLKSRSYRLARSYYIEIAPDGDILGTCFEKTVAFITKKASYNSFNKMLDEGTDDEKMNDTIYTLEEISNILSKRLRFDEIYQEVNRTEINPTKTNIIGKTKSEKIVENSAVITNYVVAKYFYKNGLPFIYRNHKVDQDFINKMEHFKNNLQYEKDDIEYKKYMEAAQHGLPKSYYGLNNDGHYGLGLKYYTHITSPLRRFADVVGSLCLDKLYFSDPTDNEVYQMEEYIKETSKQINCKAESIAHFAKNYEKIKSLKKD